MRFTTGKNGFLTVPATCILAVLALVFLASTVSVANDGITSNAIIHRAGLTVDWFTHTGVGPRGQLVDWYINVDENKSTTHFTIEAGKYREKFSQNTLSPFGKPYGVDGALEYADVRKDILRAEFANDGIEDAEIKVDQYTLPETRIYLLTSDGAVKAIDGDSGETRWATTIGDPRQPSIGVGASNQHVAAVNGTKVYCLEAETGKVLWSAQCRFAVASSPTVTDERIYVPLFNGRMESFSIADRGLVPHSLIAPGDGTARPLVTEKTVAWATNRGHLNVASRFVSKPGVAYQLRSDDAIVCQPAFKDGLFFVTSLDGFVYAVDEDRGSVVWQISTGYRISQTPIPLGNHVFVINEKQELYKIDAKTGANAPGWDKPLNGIKRFVGAGKTNLYVLDNLGQLKVLSQDSGVVISSVDFGSVQSVVHNLQTDRIYVASGRGVISCIREISSPIPHFHSNEFVAGGVDPGKPAMDSDKSDQPAGADQSDPFQLPDPNDNPFGESSPRTPKADEPGGVDPFRDPFSDPVDGGDDPSEADPFSGGDDSSDEDPFSGGSGSSEDDPFGSGGDAGETDPFGGEDDPFK